MESKHINSLKNELTLNWCSTTWRIWLPRTRTRTVSTPGNWISKIILLWTSAQLTFGKFQGKWGVWKLSSYSLVFIILNNEGWRKRRYAEISFVLLMKGEVNTPRKWTFSKLGFMVWPLKCRVKLCEVGCGNSFWLLTDNSQKINKNAKNTKIQKKNTKKSEKEIKEQNYAIENW